MTDKSGWCPKCRANRHNECSGRFWRGGMKAPCLCHHPRGGESAGEIARRTQEIRLRILAEMEKARINRNVEIQAQVGLPAFLLENNRKVINLKTGEETK